MKKMNSLVVVLHLSLGHCEVGSSQKFVKFNCRENFTCVITVLEAHLLCTIKIHVRLCRSNTVQYALCNCD